MLRAIPRALGNMAREAAHNPLWAVFGITAELVLKHYGWTAHDGSRELLFLAGQRPIVAEKLATMPIASSAGCSIRPDARWGER